jgi:peptidoglycan/xylan/chitin deacetylase (PgdA/CDA1 family)
MLRETALSADAGENERILERARRHALPVTQLPNNATCASEAELEAALDHAGLSYGSHTWSHPNLAALESAALATELVKPRQWLARYGDRVVSAISYPYGCANAAVWQAAEQAGYAAGFMISGGWVAASVATESSRYALPRLNVPANVSADGFALRAAGLIAA